MVYCAHCGTQNRDGSKFCNNCGARLSQESGLRCPMCSTPNPVESVFCINCGARLVPLTAASMPDTKPPAPPIKGLSLPAKPDLPSELSESSESSEEPAQPAAPEAAPPLALDELPDWIARLRSAETTGDEKPESAEEEPPADETSVEDETAVPDWLSRLRAMPPAENALPAESEPEAQVPDWITESSAPPAAESAAVPAEEVEMPDWLKQARAEPEPTPEPPHTDTTQVEEPDWLKQPEIGQPSGTDESKLPDWLRSPAVQVSASEEKPEKPAPVTESTETVEEPKSAEPLLESLEEAETTETAGREPFVLPEVSLGEEDDLPDWLRSASSSEPPAVPAPAIEQPTPEDVPAWVAELKPAAFSATPSATGLAISEIEPTGPLEGLRGVLPLAVAMAEPHRLEEAPRAPSQTDGGKIFESILAAPAQATAPAAKAARLSLSMRPFIYLLLLLAVLVPFLLPYDLTQSTFSIAATPAAEFYDTLQQQVPANSTVLLSFDYDPSQSGEMDLQAHAIVRDLIKRRVKIIAVSTIETGPQIAQRILDADAAAADKYVYGSSYTIVYLPGHEAGLAQFASAGFATATDYVDKLPVAQFLTAAKIKNLSDLPMVIEFAGSEEPLKTWVEQGQGHTGVRIAAAVSASVEPKARAYRNANQLIAMLSGLLGAAQYEALSSQPGIAVISVNAQSAAQLVLVFIIVLGNVAFWISRARGGAK